MFACSLTAAAGQHIFIPGISVNGTETNSIIIIGNVHEIANSLCICLCACVCVCLQQTKTYGSQREAAWSEFQSF